MLFVLCMTHKLTALYSVNSKPLTTRDSSSSSLYPESRCKIILRISCNPSYQLSLGPVSIPFRYCTITNSILHGYNYVQRKSLESQYFTQRPTCSSLIVGASAKVLLIRSRVEVSNVVVSLLDLPARLIRKDGILSTG